MTDRVDRVHHRLAGRRIQADETAAVEVLAHDLGLEPLAVAVEHHAGAGPQPLAGMHERHPRVGVGGTPDEKALRRAATGQTAAEEARRKDPRVVDDEQVARPEQVGEIGEGVMVDRAVDPPEPQQPRGAAPRRWLLGDLFRRQIEVEVRNPHPGSVPT